MATKEEQLGQMLATAQGSNPVQPQDNSPIAPADLPLEEELGSELEDEDFLIDGDEIVEPVKIKEKGLQMDFLTLAEFQRKFSTDKDNRQYVDWAWFIYDNYVTFFI